MCVCHVSFPHTFGFKDSQIFNKRFIKFSQRCPLHSPFLYDFLTNSLLVFYGAPSLIEMTRRPPPSGLGMIYFLLMICAFAVGFLLWVLVALIREGQHLATHRRKADRARRGPISRIGELIHMNPGMTQDENAEKTTGK